MGHASRERGPCGLKPAAQRQALLLPLGLFQTDAQSRRLHSTTPRCPAVLPLRAAPRPPPSTACPRRQSPGRLGHRRRPSIDPARRRRCWPPPAGLQGAARPASTRRLAPGPRPRAAAAVPCSSNQNQSNAALKLLWMRIGILGIFSHLVMDRAWKLGIAEYVFHYLISLFTVNFIMSFSN